MTNEHAVAEASLREMLERRSRRASPAGLAASILATTAVTRQQVGWTTRLRPRFEAPTGRRLLVLGILGVTLVGGALAVAGGRFTPAEKEIASTFLKPFEYAIPDGSGLEPYSGGDSPESSVMMGWVVGANKPYVGVGSSGQRGGQDDASGNTRGIIVATGERAWFQDLTTPDETPVRVVLPDDPAGFLQTLRETGGVDLGPTETTTLGVLPAWTAVGRARDGGDLHGSGSTTSTYTPWVRLDIPYRLIVAEVDDFTVFVQIWARSDAELDAFMPTATVFVDSIRFLDDAPAPIDTPAPAEKEVAARFFKPFEYAIPAGSGLDPTASGQAVAAWVVGANQPGPEDGPRWGGQAEESGNTRGILVAIGKEAWIHTTAGRLALPDDPAGFLETLRDAGPVDLEPTETTTLDGRPAMTARTALGRAVYGPPGYDLHVTGPMTGLASGVPFILLDFPYRLIVTEVDGYTIFVQIWARSNEDLDAFMPAATEFVDSIHFVDDAANPVETPAPSAKELDATFVEPFEYAIPEGSGLELGRSDEVLARWFVGADHRRGITVATGEDAWIDGPAGRQALPDDPAGFIDTLREAGSVDLDPTETTTVDGRPAMAARMALDRAVDDPHVTHLHVTGPMTGLASGPYVYLNDPQRLIVTEVDDFTVLIQIWAQSNEELDAFMPAATAFVDSIHFLGGTPVPTDR